MDIAQGGQGRAFKSPDWEKHRDEITSLYEEDKLEIVMKVIEERYGLLATPKQYKDRIKKWGVNKNAQSSEYEAMIRKQHEREEEGKESTTFRLRGREVNPDKIQRYMRSHPRPPATELDDVDATADYTETPAGISVYTPTSEARPPTPQQSQSQYDAFDPAQAASSEPPPLPPVSAYNLQGLLGNAAQSPPLPDRIASHSQSYTQEYSSLVAQAPGSDAAPVLATPPSGPQHFTPDAPQGYAFQYSNYSKKEKTLFIGINYSGQRGELKGCIQDVKNMSTFLNENFGFQRSNMLILTEDQANPMSHPTKANMLRAMQWLVKDARPNDSLFFHFSGHGGQTKSLDGEDLFNEAIYPLDFRQVGHIRDDDMHMIMVQPLQPGVRLTAIYDSTHSASALDLPYIYSTQGILKEPNLAKEAGAGCLTDISTCSNGNAKGVARTIKNFFKRSTTGDSGSQKYLATKTSPSDVILWFSTTDNENEQALTIGTMSWAFINVLKSNPQQSYVQLLNSVRDNNLAQRISSKPQLCCSHPLNTNLLFTL